MTNGLGPIRVFVGIITGLESLGPTEGSQRFLENLESSLKARKFVNETRGDKQLLEFTRKYLKNPPRTYKYTKHSISLNQSEVASVIVSFPNKQLLRFSLKNS